MKGLSPTQRLLIILGASSASSVVLYLVGVTYYEASIFWFLNWNLVLAWVPLLLALLMIKLLKTTPWVSWSGGLLTILWLLFLPNSFYLISDLMHLNIIFTNNPLFFAVMLFSYGLNGLILGCVSLYLIHLELLKRLNSITAHTWITFVLLLCSFAIYLGRNRRWSTWDILLNPAGVIFDVSDKFINPVSGGQVFQVTMWFFILLTTAYFTIYGLARLAKQYKSS